MKNETKLEKVKKFLDENNIEYSESKHKGERGHSDLVLWKYRIFIKLSGDDDDEFFERHKKKFPIFIRDGETPKFVLEKVQQTIIKSMTVKQNLIMLRKKRIEGKREFEECMKRHEEKLARKNRMKTKK